MRLLLLGASDEVAALVDEAWDDDLARGVAPGPDAPPLAWDGPLPSVVVLDGTRSPDPLGPVPVLVRDFPGVGVVVLVPDAGALALAALRVGARDVVDLGAGAGPLRVALDRVAHASAPDAEADPTGAGSRGRVISVLSPKGGVGKTTVATNLAVGLAAAAPRSTVLVDLDIQFGDVASGLNLEPEYHLPSAVHGPASRDTMVLKSYLTLHETGLYVLCAPESPADADGITAADVERLLRSLAEEFRYVVVDTAPGLSEHTLAALDASTELVLLTSMDVPGLRGLRKELDTLTALDLGMARRHVVVNLCDAQAGLSLADVEATLATKVDVLLPRSKAVRASVNLGVPVLQSGARDPATKPLKALVARLVEPGTAAAPAVKALRRSRRSAGPVPRRAASGWFRQPRRVSG